MAKMQPHFKRIGLAFDSPDVLNADDSDDDTITDS